MIYPSYPTIMDVALSMKLDDDQLLTLNKARLHLRILHFKNSEEYCKVVWPKRKVSSRDIEFFKSFLKNEVPLVGRHLVPEPQPLTHVTKVNKDYRMGDTITIAYDGSRSQDRMAASISVFQGHEEIFMVMREVHGKPASSTRAKIYGVVMCLDYFRQLKTILSFSLASDYIPIKVYEKLYNRDCSHFSHFS